MGGVVVDRVVPQALGAWGCGWLARCLRHLVIQYVTWQIEATAEATVSSRKKHLWFSELLVCCCSGPDTAPRIRHCGDGPVLQQANAGMLSSTLTQSRSLLLCCASGERYRWWSPVCGVALEQTFTIREPVRGALPDFRIEQTDCEGQRSAAGFD